MTNIKSIWQNQTPTGDIIIKTKLDAVPHLNCYAATNHITGQHLYIMAVSKNTLIPELKNYRFKSVEIYALTNVADGTSALYIYLLDNDLKDIFALFIQNITDDIAQSITENEAVTTTLNVVSQWKNLFDKINFDGLTIEQQKGLIGELFFFNYLLDNKIPVTSVLNAWTGADFEDKDFVFGSVGIEIKLTASKYPKIQITNERQLDTENLTDLFLILYTTEEVKEGGFSLNSLVTQTQKNILTDEERHFFNDKLLLLGYRKEDKEQYNKIYALKKTYLFVVNTDFPRIIKSQLPAGIYNTSYSIEISAVEKFITQTEKILQYI